MIEMEEEGEEWSVGRKRKNYSMEMGKGGQKKGQNIKGRKGVSGKEGKSRPL